MADSVGVKATFGTDTRRFSVSRKEAFSTLYQTVRELFNVGGAFTLKYIDQDGDHISLATPRDLQEALLHNTSLRLVVVPTGRAAVSRSAPRAAKVDVLRAIQQAQSMIRSTVQQLPVHAAARKALGVSSSAGGMRRDVVAGNPFNNGNTIDTNVSSDVSNDINNDFSNDVSSDVSTDTSIDDTENSSDVVSGITNLSNNAVSTFADSPFFFGSPISIVTINVLATQSDNFDQTIDAAAAGFGISASGVGNGNGNIVAPVASGNLQSVPVGSGNTYSLPVGSGNLVATPINSGNALGVGNGNGNLAAQANGNGSGSGNNIDNPIGNGNGSGSGNIVDNPIGNGNGNGSGNNVDNPIGNGNGNGSGNNVDNPIGNGNGSGSGNNVASAVGNADGNGNSIDAALAQLAALGFPDSQHNLELLAKNKGNYFNTLQDLINERTQSK